MTKEESIQYSKAYAELYEILNNITNEQRSKIPSKIINNISKSMNKDYKFTFDKSKGIFEQKLLVETEAMLVEIYERYIASEEEKEMWQRYDRYCLNKIEKEKRKEFGFEVTRNMSDSNNQKILIKNEKNDANRLIEPKKENMYNKVLNFFKKFFQKNK